MPSEVPGGSYLRSIQCGFQLARELHRGCRPVHLLVGISEEGGPAAVALAVGAGRSLREVLAAASDIPGGSAGYLHGQAQQAAMLFASGLGQQPEAGHLLVALLDQGTAEVTRTLDRAGLDPSAVRQTALAVIGAPADQPRITLPPLDSAGTGDRPPLPVADLNERAWAVLRWRHDHLPVGLLRRPADRRALDRLERDAAWQLAGRLGLDDDQRYSLIWHHARQVEQRVAGARGDLPAAARPGLPVRRHAFLNVAVGWGTWLENRQADLHYRWFRTRALRHYRDAPGVLQCGPGTAARPEVNLRCRGGRAGGRWENLVSCSIRRCAHPWFTRLRSGIRRRCGGSGRCCGPAAWPRSGCCCCGSA